MKVGDKVVICDHNIKATIKNFYDETRVVVVTETKQEYLILKSDLRVIKERNHSTWNL